MTIYAQVVNGIVNLVGGIEVGLPHNHINDLIKVVNITDLEIKPQIGWTYDGVNFSEIITPIIVTPTPLPVTIEQIDEIKENQLILMDAIATLFETVIGGV